MRRFEGSYAGLLDELIRERTGIAAGTRDDAAKLRVLSRAMERAGASNEAAYLSLVRRDHRAFDELIADLTVPETYFFRDPPSYELLRREVLPAIVAAQQPERCIEVWSAGCASGEEPYSLAILLEQERLGERARVLGTDVSVRALARAERAHYGRWSLRATRAEQVARYFEPVGREYRLLGRVRRKVRLQQHSLSAPLYPSPASRPHGFDLILCRNVLIYFDRQASAQVAQKFARSLADHGWLMMGPSDPLLDLQEWCDTVITPCGLLYKRRAAARVQPRLTHKFRPHAHGQPQRARKAEPEAPPPRSPSSEQAPPDEPSLEQQVERLRALSREQGLKVAEAGCRDLLSRHALSAPLHLLHATLLLDLGHMDAAAGALRRALYLDRSLLLAQMLSATLAERRSDREGARRQYSQAAREAGALPAHEPVLLGDGLTCGELVKLASQRARALDEEERG